MLELPVAPGQRMGPALVALDLASSKRRGRPRREVRDVENRMERLRGEVKEEEKKEQVAEDRRATRRQQSLRNPSEGNNRDVLEMFTRR